MDKLKNTKKRTKLSCAYWEILHLTYFLVPVITVGTPSTRMVFVSPSAIAPCKIGRKSAYCFALRFTPSNVPFALAQKPLLPAICAPVIELTLLKSQLLILTLLKSSDPVNAPPKILEMSTLGLSVVFGAFVCMAKNCSGVRFLYIPRETCVDAFVKSSPVPSITKLLELGVIVIE